MCNACNNICCGLDMFSGCGCDLCDEPECHTPPGDEDRAPPRRFECRPVEPEAASA